MEIKLHKNATTTLSLRKVIKESPLSAYALGHNLERRIKAARDEIRTLIARLNVAKAENVPGKRGRKKGDVNVDAHIKEILHKRRVRDILEVTVSPQADKLSVSIVRKTHALEVLTKTFGKSPPLYREGEYGSGGDCFCLSR